MLSRIFTETATRTLSTVLTLALFGLAAAARAEEPPADAETAPADATKADPAKMAPAKTARKKKQWVWLTRQGCWGYGYQRADGLWVIDPGSKRVPVAEAPAQPAPPVGDPYGFIGWLNSVRASSGLGPVGYDPNLAAWAQENNNAQAAMGLGHHVMGPARRQNSAMGDVTSIGAQWLASPAHAAALLDPTISMIGIAGLGAWWTFNAY